MRKLATLLTGLPLLVAWAGNAAWVLAEEPPGAAVLLVYLEPGGEGESEPPFGVASLAAVSDDGRALSLRLLDAALGDDKGDGARLLAAGSVPAGRYSGLRLEYAGSDAREGSQEATSVTAELPFRLEKGQGLVLNLTMAVESSGDSSVADGRMSALVRRPLRPPPAAIGVVSVPDQGYLTFYDKVSGRAVGVLPTGKRPMGVAIDEERRRAYVAISGEDSVLAVDLSEHRVLASLRLRGRDRPTELALTPDGAVLLAVNTGSRTVSVIDPGRLVEIDRLEVGEDPRSIVLDPSGERAYVLDEASSGVSVIDVKRGRSLGTIATDAEPLRGRFDRGGRAFYVIHRWSPYLTVIDPAAFAVTERVFIGSPAVAIEVDIRTDLIYLSSRDSTGIDVYDPLALLPIDSIEIGNEIIEMVIEPENGCLHILQSGPSEVAIVRIVGGQPVAGLELGGAPYRVSLYGDR